MPSMYAAKPGIAPHSKVTRHNPELGIMAKMMTGDSQVCSAGIIFHPFLDAANGYRLSGEWPFLYQKDLFHFVRWSHPEIVQKRMKGVVADIDNPILGALAVLDKQDSAFKINVTEGKMGNFFHPQSTAEHNHKHGSIPWSFQILEKDFYLLLFEMLGKPPGELHNIRLLHRVHDRDFLLFREVVIKLTYAVEITVYRLWL
jgi:hypothetical protein